MKKKAVLFIAALVFEAGSLSADVLAEWTFNDRSSLAAVLDSSSVAAGAVVSGLSFNDEYSCGLNEVTNQISTEGRDQRFFRLRTEPE